MEKKRPLSSRVQSTSKRIKLKDSGTSEEALESGKLFNGFKVVVLSAGMGKARSGIFQKQLIKNGAQIQEKFNNMTSHIIVDEAMTSQRFLKITNISQEDLSSGNVVVVKANWLSTCLSEEKLVSTSEFELFIQFTMPESTVVKRDENDSDVCKKREEKSGKVAEVGKPGNSEKETPVVSKPVVKTHLGYDSDDSSYVPSDEDEDEKRKEDEGTSSASNLSTPNTTPTKLPKGNWVCAKPSTSQTVNFNEHITEKLEKLMNAYKNTKDQWRALGYRKAIGALKAHPKAVTSWEEASAIPGVGSKIADKISEIIQSGHLRKIDHICQGEEAKTLDLFNKIWGVGPTVAQEFVQMGFKTLEDVKTKAKLTKQQQIGLNHYYDFLDRMPREEAAEIGRVVEQAAHEFDPNFICTTCGSFRRGKKTCGDVDVLISHLDGHSHKGILFKLLEKLHSTGFLTDDLIKVEERGEQKKYMGVCKLPGENQKYRRLDIIVAPYSEYPCALVHFTGSDHFNRSIRALAGKKGMSLSEHALRTGVIRRGRDRIHEGTPLPVTSEEDIFRHMGLEYRPPHERDY
ncbi:DNA polymerase lambda [Holothuria leucospilota]|uniref:DNA polymerase lambda n=1 Tax=Holothuria leucospilota TaxID=206669 RepID=A0A9Q0YU31_HOLLE|nr:DNA polymerase lambda [Holothuria leucospilota]